MPDQVDYRLIDSSVTLTPAVSTGGTLSLPAVTGKYHYIYAITAQRTCATALVIGTGALTITTTNLSGSPQWQLGNAMAVGQIEKDIEIVFANCLRSQSAGTATTFVFPAPGTNVTWNATVWYTVGD